MTPIHQRLIDSTLLIVNARTLELVVWTKFPVREDAQHEERIRDRLRQSKLGYDLADLADYAEGEERVSTERARQAISDVSKILFSQLYTSSLTPPPDFYKSDLGQLFNEVYLRMSEGEELLTPTEAYREIGVTRRVIYNYIESGKLQPLYLNGQTKVLASQVGALKEQRRQPQVKH